MTFLNCENKINNYTSENFIKKIFKLNNLKINLNIKQIPITQKINYIIDNPKNILFLKNDKENKNLIFTLRRIAILQNYSFINYFTDVTKEELIKRDILYIIGDFIFDNVELTYMYSTVGYCSCAITYNIPLNEDDFETLSKLKIALLEK